MDNGTWTYTWEKGSPVILRLNGTPYTYVKNLQGDIVGLIDSTGALVVEYKYDAWGKPISTRTLTTSYDALAELNPFRYRGYVWDEENQFLYLNSRYYSPMLLRFINADIILNDENKVCYRSLFTYCTNNPTNKVDVYGYRSTSLLNTSPFCMYSAEEALGNGGGYVGGSGTGIAILGGLGLIFSWFAGEKIADKAASSSSSIASTNSSFSATTVEEQLAQTAGKFGNLQCFLAKDAMLALLLKMNLHGSVIELTFPGDYVWSITYSRTISENGRHVGILYKGKVYCNVHPYGLPKEKWINDFDSANGEPLITEIPF